METSDETKEKVVNPLHEAIKKYYSLLNDKRIPNPLKIQLEDPQSAFYTTEYLKQVLIDSDYFDDQKGLAHNAWNQLGYIYRLLGRTFDALLVFWTEYQEFCHIQEIHSTRLHKGSALCFMYDLFKELNYPVHAKRYIMLTLCEDAITQRGIVTSQTTGAYARLRWNENMSDVEISRYSKSIWDMCKKDVNNWKLPEAILQKLDNKWMSGFPSSLESNYYLINPYYCDLLISKIGSSRGVALEEIATYMLNTIPGCRAMSRVKSHSSDYDVVCSQEGNLLDFRAEIERYFICECKDWKKPANFTTIAKLSRILDSVKSKFGIFFSVNGITGDVRHDAARREQLKLYQDRGLVIITINKNDLIAVKNGANLISIIRDHYEKARLDLYDANKTTARITNKIKTRKKSIKFKPNTSTLSTTGT